MGFWETFYKRPATKKPLIVSEKDFIPKQEELPSGYYWGHPDFESWSDLIMENYSYDGTLKIKYPENVLRYWYYQTNCQHCGIYKDDILIGSISGKVRDLSIFHETYLGYNVDFLCVDLSYRKKGWAGKLIRELSRIAKENKIWTGLHLSVKKCLDTTAELYSYRCATSSPIKKKNLNHIKLIPETKAIDILPTNSDKVWFLEHVHIPENFPGSVLRFGEYGHIVGFPLIFSYGCQKIKTFYSYIFNIAPAYRDDALVALRQHCWNKGFDQIYIILPYKLKMPWIQFGAKMWMHLYNWNTKYYPPTKDKETVFWTY